MHINLWKATLGCKQMEMHFEIVELMIKKKKRRIVEVCTLSGKLCGLSFSQEYYESLFVFLILPGTVVAGCLVPFTTTRCFSGAVIMVERRSLG